MKTTTTTAETTTPQETPPRSPRRGALAAAAPLALAAILSLPSCTAEVGCAVTEGPGDGERTVSCPRTEPFTASAEDIGDSDSCIVSGQQVACSSGARFDRATGSVLKDEAPDTVGGVGQGAGGLAGLAGASPPAGFSGPSPSACSAVSPGVVSCPGGLGARVPGGAEPSTCRALSAPGVGASVVCGAPGRSSGERFAADRGSITPATATAPVRCAAACAAGSVTVSCTDGSAATRPLAPGESCTGGTAGATGPAGVSSCARWEVEAPGASELEAAQLCADEALACPPGTEADPAACALATELAPAAGEECAELIAPSIACADGDADPIEQDPAACAAPGGAFRVATPQDAARLARLGCGTIFGDVVIGGAGDQAEPLTDPSSIAEALGSTVILRGSLTIEGVDFSGSSGRDVEGAIGGLGLIAVAGAYTVRSSKVPGSLPGIAGLQVIGGEVEISSVEGAKAIDLGASLGRVFGNVTIAANPDTDQILLPEQPDVRGQLLLVALDALSPCSVGPLMAWAARYASGGVYVSASTPELSELARRCLP